MIDPPPNETSSMNTKIVEVYMAGDISQAKQIVRLFVYREKCCVTVQPIDYFYNGGEESGFVIGFRQYPKFPKSQTEIKELAEKLAKELRCGIHQDSYMVVDHSGDTRWSTLRV